jgi:hypothetical protein
MNHNEIFNKLWKDYITWNPSVKKVYDLFVEKGESVVNDHIAFRTFDHSSVNIDVLSGIFLKAGYEEKGQYNFEDKKLNARHYEHNSDPDAPRVFISELRTAEFSSYLQERVKEILSYIPEGLATGTELIFAGTPWQNVSWDVYSRLREESEYAAWLYVYGFRANHFTVSINHLKTFNGIVHVNSFLKQNGFLINDAGGEVKGTPEELLEQSSIKAGLIPYHFTEGIYDIPGCYYEFAKRYPAPDGKIYNGFIAKSADKIFESTDYYPNKSEK